MVQTLPGIDANWRAELLDNVAQLERLTVAQRVEELQARITEVGMSGLSDAEKAELRDLQSRRA
jgi:DNA primase